jgi:hypothetical protein
MSVEDTFQWLDKIPQGNLLEFGLYTGNCLRRLIDGAEEVKQPFNEIWAFDSFKGLPEENEFVECNPDWKKGVFNVCEELGVNTKEEAIEIIRKSISRPINIVEGFFDKSLTKELGQKLTNSVSYLHVDVDMYISTFHAMDWALKYKICKAGAIIRYDDWCSTREYQGGNSLAHIQLEQKYNAKFNRLSTNVFCLMGN